MAVGRNTTSEQIMAAIQNSISNPAIRNLGPEASAELRERLIAELANVGSGDAAAIWRIGRCGRTT